MANEQTIWSYLLGKIGNPHGAAGLMGNLYAESGLSPVNLENAYERKLGYTDATYTAAVDAGRYTEFARDSAGYGLAQWTYHTRKAALLAFARSRGASIGDLDMQLAFLWKELTESFPAVVKALKTAQTVRAASDAVMIQFERPRDQSEAALARRATYGQTYFDKYAGTQKGNGNSMNESEAREKLVTAARGFIGYSEASGKHRQIIDLYNSVKPLPRGYAVKYSDAWCATFVSALAIKCGMTGIIPRECSCYYQVEAFKKLGAWEERDDYKPKKGDVIYYDWQDTGAGDNTGTPDHVGVVEDFNGVTITVIEGNYKDTVDRRYITVNAKSIRGYGVPKYAAWAAQQQTQQPDPWYVKSGEWAAAQAAGITDGTQPNRTATRAEAVTMIWRAAAKAKKQEGAENPFKDVAPSTVYYYDAVVWAAANGVAFGVGDGMFQPQGEITRGQIVTMIWRAFAKAKKQEGAKNPFKDVAAAAYYYDAVVWAAANGITSGTSKTTFSPDSKATRAEIAAMIVRAAKKEGL